MYIYVSVRACVRVYTYNYVHNYQIMLAASTSQTNKANKKGSSTGRFGPLLIR
uniref:Uncharacterized protein n=1 Tax=Rhizophora mucronata TaxID=61149 RepID=A0A2P2P9G1_RHIMU